MYQLHLNANYRCFTPISFFTSVLTNAVKQAARSEFILPEESGFLEADEGETTADISQHDIVKATDLQTAQKVCLMSCTSSISAFSVFRLILAPLKMQPSQIITMSYLVTDY